MIIVTVSQ